MLAKNLLPSPCVSDTKGFQRFSLEETFLHWMRLQMSTGFTLADKRKLHPNSAVSVRRGRHISTYPAFSENYSKTPPLGCLVWGRAIWNDMDLTLSFLNLLAWYPKDLCYPNMHPFSYGFLWRQSQVCMLITFLHNLSFLYLFCDLPFLYHLWQLTAFLSN